MNAVTPSNEYMQASLPLELSHGSRPLGEARSHTDIAGARSRRLIRSVVEKLGLGNFSYLQGRSGRRYVFTAINQKQAQQYGRALFARVDEDGDVEISDRAAKLTDSHGSLYVHLLDEQDQPEINVIEDLRQGSGLTS